MSGNKVLATALLVFAAPLAWAGSASGSLGVSAAVNNNCTVSTSPVGFGTYDPIVTNNAGGADVLGFGTLTVNCTKNAGVGGGNAVTIGLSFGQNAAASPRKMKNASLDLLNYDLYLPALASGEYTDCTTLSTIWNTTNVLAPAANFWQGTAHSISVCGKVPKGQTTVSVGSYSDTVNVTVNF
jgi:Uncharacterized secreted protein